MHHFCTYFDHNYLPRGLALYRSLLAHCPDFQLWVLCLSEQCHDTLARLALPGLKLLTLGELEQFEPRLREARQNRSTIEYYFTCSPVLPLWVLDHAPGATAVTYVDGDLLLFGRLDELWAEIGDSSIAITPHRLPPALREFERYGIFNVGWLTFRRDANARACLEWWRERCLEWCYDRLENDRFADQKYLDVWPAKFAGVKIIQHPGVNLAPWNLAAHRLEWRDNRVFVDGRPLLVFHFHGLKQITARYFNPHWQRYCVPRGPVLIERIYRPYLKSLAAITNEVGLAKEQAGLNPRLAAKADRQPQPSWWNRVRAQWRLVRCALRGDLIRS